METRLNLRSTDDDRRLKIKYVRMRGLPGPRMMVLNSNNMTARVCWFNTTNDYKEETFTWDMIEIDEQKLVISDDILPNRLFSETIIKHILDCVKNDRKIEAIKTIRVQTGWGLKESKEYLEAREDQLRRIANTFKD